MGNYDDGESPPDCNCPATCRRLVSRSADNPDRPFWKCPNDGGGGAGCGFFAWCDGISDGGGAGVGCSLGDGGGGGGGLDMYSVKDSGRDKAMNMADRASVLASFPGESLDPWTENNELFGHSDFRNGQEAVVVNAMKGRDVFCLMPTGGGKSLCYQLPAWCCPGLSVIFSPLL